MRFLLEVFGFRIGFEIAHNCPEPADEEDEDRAIDLSGGDLGSYRIGFQPSTVVSYDVDLPDRGAY